MEQRNNCAGPRSMMDASILRQILADMAEGEPGCGCGNRNHSHHKMGGKPAYGDGKNGGCGGQARQEVAGGDGSQREACVAGAGIPTLAGLPLVMAYVPNQEWEGILEPEEALEAGTLFTGLNFPWYPSKCRKNGRCGK